MKRNHLFLCLSLLVLTLALLLSSWVGMSFLGSKPVYASQVLGASTEVTASPTLIPYPVQRAGTKDPYIRAQHVALYDKGSGKFLYEKDAEATVAIASTTKMMTAWLTVTYGSLDDVITISRDAASLNGSIMGLLSNEKITVRNVLEGALLVSGNDAAHALAQYIGQKLLNNPDASVEAAETRFVAEMNAKAAALEMTNTHYMDPAGLNDDGHSTAHDLAKLAAHVLDNQEIARIVATATTTVTNTAGTLRHDLRNSNRLVADYNYPGILGGKTGFTPSAGHCLITAAKQGDMTLIAVVLNTDYATKEASALEARKLLDWGFASWQLN